MLGLIPNKAGDSFKSIALGVKIAIQLSQNEVI
jgi:hypothetical protein